MRLYLIKDGASIKSSRTIFIHLNSLPFISGHANVGLTQAREAHAPNRPLLHSVHAARELCARLPALRAALSRALAAKQRAAFRALRPQAPHGPDAGRHRRLLDLHKQNGQHLDNFLVPPLR